MRLFLLSLGILFAASVIGYISILILAIRQPVDIPPLPKGLWLSTLLLLTSSGTIQGALGAARRGAQRRLHRFMLATTALGLGFLAIQVTCWIQWAGPMRVSLGETDRIFVLTGFYVLTGLHAAHVIGGLVPLIIVTARSRTGRYSHGNYGGVLYSAMYWHFLDAVWVVLFVTLLIGT